MLPQKISIKWLRQQYAYGHLTPSRVIESIIKRANADKKMNIWICKPDMKFIRPYLKRLKKSNFDKYPLWGIPFAIKDNIDLAGVSTTAACPAYSYIPKESAAVVENLISQGAIPVGKTNMDQFATGLVGTRSPYGEVHNALCGEYISGGSSSGSAVCVARGHSAFALGTDTAGSGRVPAMLNGITGFKPSFGAWSVKGVVPACETLDCVSVFANNFEDCVSVDNAARKYESMDKWSRETHRIFSQKPKYLCLPKNNLEFFGDFANDYAACWKDFEKSVKSLGIPIHYIDTNLFRKAAEVLYGGAYITERWSALGKFIEKHEKKIFLVTKKILESGKSPQFSASELFNVIHNLKAYKCRVKKILKEGVLILPTTGGTWTRKQVRENPIETNNKMGLYTSHCNLLDLAAIAIPFGKTCAEENGICIPFGITVFSLADKESYLIAMAELIENLKKREVTVAVHGVHMKGMPLNSILTDIGGAFIKKTKTAEEYRMFALNTMPQKPGIVKVKRGGKSIITQLWSIPQESFAELVCKTLSPMVFGKINLINGETAEGFLCEPYALKGAKDITSYGGWKEFIKTKRRKTK
ncbi:MAG: allophanate hydrolase [Endomicrobium sp.]|nr:allophanate hydrolase [Endomicrobium sp.]